MEIGREFFAFVIFITIYAAYPVTALNSSNSPAPISIGTGQPEDLILFFHGNQLKPQEIL